MLLCWEAYACGGHIFWHLMAACLQRGHHLTLDGIYMPPRHVCPPEKHLPWMDLICPLHVYASHRAAASRGSASSLTRTPRRLKAHPSQLDCPNSTQSLSNVVNRTFCTQEIQKTYETQFSHFQEKKETRQEIYNRRRHQRENQHPERDQKHLRLKR